MTSSDLPTLDAAQSAIVAQVQRTVCEDASRDRPLSERESAKLATIVEMTAMRRVRLGLPFDAADLHAEAMTTVEALATSS